MIRVRFLSAGKAAAMLLFLSITAALVGYLIFRNKRPWQKADRPELRGKVVAVLNDTRYVHEVGGKVRFILTSGADKTFQDGTHELEQVRLESHGVDGTRNDSVVSDRAHVSDPSDLNKLDAEFISNVVVHTSDDLIIKTNYLHYSQNENKVDTKEPVEFERKTMAGRATGMLVEVNDERVHLLKDVDVTIKSEPPANAPNQATTAASRPVKEARSEETPEEREARIARKRARKAARRRAAEEAARNYTEIAGRASEKPAKGAAAQDPHSANAPKPPVRIRGVEALLEKKEHRVTFTGSVIVTRGADEMRADKMTGFLDALNHFERMEARGSSALKQTDKSEVTCDDMDFFFGDDHLLNRAEGRGNVYAHSLGEEPMRESRSDTVEVTFVQGPDGAVADTATAAGNSSLHVQAPKPRNEKDNPNSRHLTANVITMQFFPGGKMIKTANAVGNAVITVLPTRAEQKADKKTIHAPQMSAQFFEDENRIHRFEAGGGVKTEIEAMVAGAHQPRITTSKRLTADFAEDSQDIDQIIQEGDFKYVEGDRHGVAERAVYDGRDDIVHFRGKRPMGWDNKGRTQADELDYDRGNDEMHARGDVRTTYYSPETTGNSTPLKKTKSPIFITAERADAKNENSVAVYTGNARGWQDDNFVKGDRIELYNDEKRMAAFGHVESALYTVERETSPGKKEIVPGFATADRMTYSDETRLVHYDGSVKARQGTDHIQSAAVDVYLKDQTNEVDHMIAEGAVVMTQPGRKGVGEKMTYTADDGRAVLIGKNARIDDDEKGSTMGSELTFYSRDDKVSVDNKQTAGRVRSTHRLTKGKGK